MDSCWPASNTDPALSSAPHGLPPFLVHSILDFSMKLQDRVALITGSGRAIAQLFAKEGAAVFLTARTEKELASTAAAIAHAGGRASYATADLSRETDCAQVVAAAREKFGRIDILVTMRGIMARWFPWKSIR